MLCMHPETLSRGTPRWYRLTITHNDCMQSCRPPLRELSRWLISCAKPYQTVATRRRTASAAGGPPVASAAAGEAVQGAAICPLQQSGKGPAAPSRIYASLLGRRQRLSGSDEAELPAPESPPLRPWRLRSTMRRSSDAGTGWSGGELDRFPDIKSEAGRSRWRAAAGESSGDLDCTGSHGQVWALPVCFG